MIKKVHVTEIKKNDYLKVNEYYTRQTGKAFHEVISIDTDWMQVEIILKDFMKPYKLKQTAFVIVDRVDIRAEIIEAREKALQSQMGRYFDWIDVYKRQGTWVCKCTNINVWSESKCTCGLSKPKKIRCKMRE